MSYKSMKYSVVQKVLGNLDKCSRNGDSKVVRSPWGVFKMYKSCKHRRFYTISGSSVFHNGGSYKIGSLRRMIFAKFG